MIFGVDVDGVCADFTGHLLKLIGGRLTSEDITSWELFDQLTNDECVMADGILKMDQFWRDLPLIPGALEGVSYLRTEGDVVFVTSPWNDCQTWGHARLKWLDQHFKISRRDLIITERKELIGVDYLIDDKPDTVVKFNKGRPFGPRAFLFDQPHNRRRLDEPRTRVCWKNPATIYNGYPPGIASIIGGEFLD